MSPLLTLHSWMILLSPPLLKTSFSLTTSGPVDIILMEMVCYINYLVKFIPLTYPTKFICLEIPIATV